MFSNRSNRMINRFLVITALAIYLFQCVPLVSADPQKDLALSKVIGQALANPVLAHGIQGVLIKSLKDGRVLYERNIDLALVPASNLKLLVSAAALEFLGPDYHVQTSLYASGVQTADGALKGDLILVGEGDPTFKYEYLREMALKIKALGIKSIRGNVIGDDTRFDDVRLGEGWAWDCEPYFDFAQISAVNLNKNVVDVWVRPGKGIGAPASIELTPPSGYMTIRNECTTSKAGLAKNVLATRIRGRNIIQITGAVPLGYKPSTCEDSITVEDPTLFTCSMLAVILKKEGIRVNGQIIRGEKPEGARLVASHESPDISKIIALMNKPSDNLIAECLLKMLGAKAKGEGSSTAGIDVESGLLKKIGVDVAGLRISDGSGLSRLNHISPNDMVTLLTYMYSHKYSKEYIDSLSVAGVDGTLKRRFKNTPAEGHINAKTGFLSHVSAISGFATTKSGEPVVFSLIFNNHLCKNAQAHTVQDEILTAVVNLE